MPGSPIDAEARLLRQYAPLLLSLARRAVHLEADDALQEARVALLTAIRTFAPDRERRLSTYAYTVVGNALRRNGLPSLATIGIPNNLRADLCRVRRAEAALEIALGRTATEDEVAVAAGLTETRIRAVRGLPLHRVSLDDGHIGPSGDLLSLSDILADDGPRLEDVIANAEEQRALVAVAMAALTDTERQVVTLRCGLPPFGQPRSMTEVAATVGTTPQYAGEIWRRAVRRMRRAVGGRMEEPPNRRQHPALMGMAR